MDVSGWTVSNNYIGLTFSTWNGLYLFGGFNKFGNSTIVSKQFLLPSHYKVKITVEFWKIDSWDNEFVYLIVDDKLWTKHYYWPVGIQLCGDNSRYDWREEIEPITVIMNHNSESLILIMTTNLDESPDAESWAFRDFTLSIVKCPSGCLFCSDNDCNNSKAWISFLSFWHESLLHESIELDGWMKNDNIQPSTYKCVSFDLVGGYLNLAPDDKLDTIIQNLGFHYQIQINVQLWKIDTWNNENFELLVDDQIYNQTVLGTTGFYSICGSTGLESILNIAVTLPHSSSSCKITMRTTHNVATTNAYWGIRAFNIYIAQNCYYGCKQCLGPLKTDCTVCSRGWVLYQNKCVNCVDYFLIKVPFILLSQILINQVQDPHSDDKIPIEINLLETNQQLDTQGTFTYSINNNQKYYQFKFMQNAQHIKKCKAILQSVSNASLKISNNFRIIAIRRSI